MSWEKCHGMLSFFASQFQNRHNSHKIVLDGPQNAPQGIGDCADKLLYTYRAIVLPVMGAYTFYKWKATENFSAYQLAPTGPPGLTWMTRTK